jgi:hypothetical protein
MTNNPITPNLGLPLMAPSQARKHITLNDSLISLDALVQLVVEGTSNTPEFEALTGSRYIIATEPDPAWVGHEGAIAVRGEAGWTIIEPKSGWLCYDKSAGQLRIWNNTHWSALSLGDTLHVPASLGVGVEPTSNALTVRGDSVLFEGHDGSHRLKISKALDTDTASIIFEIDHSGRFELGLTGDDALIIRKSSDGSTWTTAMRIPTDTGAVEFEQSPTVNGAPLVSANNMEDPMASKGRLTDTDDLDNFVETGYFYQTHSSRATAALNYPTDQAGILIVFGAGAFVSQQYRVYSLAPNGLADATFTRGRTGTQWSSWQRLATI